MTQHYINYTKSRLVHRLVGNLNSGVLPKVMKINTLFQRTMPFCIHFSISIQFFSFNLRYLNNFKSSKEFKSLNFF